MAIGLEIKVRKSLITSEIVTQVMKLIPIPHLEKVLFSYEEEKIKLMNEKL